MDIKVHFHDFSHVLVECDESIFYELRDYFSFEADGYKFNPKFKYGQWDGRIRLLDYNRKLPFGLVHQLYRFCEQFEYKIWVDPKIEEKEELSRERFDEWLNGLEIYSGSKTITPHDYQADSVYKGIVSRRRILNLPTSAGKSLIQALLSRYFIENYDGKILVLVPTTSLVRQMHDDFIDYRLFGSEHIEMIGGGKKAGNNKNAMIVVSTWQSAVKQPKEWFDQFGCLLADEMHLTTGLSLTKIIEGLTNCAFKFGLSGSLKDGKANLMQYMGMFGEIFKPVSTKDLMDRGAVTTLKINSIFVRYPDEACAKMKGKDYQTEIKVITKGSRRNQIVANLAVKLAKKNENTFVMFRFAEHGKMLLDLIKKAGHEEVYFINGEVDTNTRDALKKMAEKGKGIIFVASYGVFSTGISIKNLHNLIFAHPTKSKVTVLQAVGRVLRLHDSKAIATVFDIIDDMGVKPKSASSKKKYVHLNYALKHALERIQRYADEQFDYTMKQVDL